ncbi:MAG: DUF2851 family protein [Chitinophagia bacterium]|nr:DUF2851 family protein [Chitinophagia bacterium]
MEVFTNAPRQLSNGTYSAICFTYPHFRAFVFKNYRSANIRAVRTLIYTFDKEHPKPAPKKLGQTSFYNIVINTLAPIKYLHARANGMDKEASDALTLLSAVPPETNHIIDKWKQNQWVAENASQTQSMIQMHNRYCTAFKCLQCSIGLSILRKGAR